MQKIAILGAGESGVGAALLAQQQGASVWVSDAGKIADRFISVLKKHAIPFEEGSHTIDKFFDSDLVIKSPGIPEHAPIMREISAAQRPVISEIEYAFRLTGARIIAVTGSNGKTTTTSLIWHLLQAAGIKAALAGNIGKSFAWQVATDPQEIYVLEISSFQLDDIVDFRPEVAVLTNITPDHLDRYGYSLDRYGKAKFRITENQQLTDSFVYCLEDPETLRQMEVHEVAAQPWGFGLTRGLEGSRGWTKGSRLILDGAIWGDVERSQLLGQHNQRNMLAALLAVKAFGVSHSEALEKGLYSFKAIEHRLEKVREPQGVLFINDSKATNVDAVYYALEGMSRPTIWLAGGVDKGNEYEVLQPLVRDKVKAIIVLGQHSEKFYRDFPETPTQQVDNMAEAVALANELASPGDAVLLSPACASFDLFQNYEDRGRQFKEAVMRIQE